ncbi:MAG TPA: hypothetical protein H9709_09680 [Candidatus Gemmiger stercoripullorum]|nr:hypothetical protein [Candidatus Gemmiger stercoripullorum]
MAAAPPAAAAGDLLYCLGLGLALGAVRDVCGLVLGRGRLRDFFCDVAAFACAAVLVCGFAAGASASGVPRWYMALGLLAGALAWRQAVSGALHRATRPLRRAANRLRAAAARRFAARRGKKAEKKTKRERNPKKMLQKDRRVLYN